MTKYAKCDSCGGIYPQEMVKEVKFSYSVFNHASKDRLVSTDVFGMLCPNCSQRETTTTKQQETPKTEIGQKPASTRTTSSGGRKKS